MASDPYTLDGARRILADTPKVIEKLDRLLGLTILASGAGYLATGVTELVTVFGWVDQKNETIRLLDGLVSAGYERLRKGERRERFEVLAATHTALVHGSFFTAMREVLGPAYDRIDLGDEDLTRLTTTAAGERAVGLVAAGRVPMPDATCGLHRSITDRIEPFYRELTRASLEFFAGFDGWPRDADVRPSDPLVQLIVERAARRYRAEYVRLATEVREFEIWATLGEHAATQELAGTSLARLEEWVCAIVRNDDRRTARVLSTVGELNREVLAATLIPVGEAGDLGGVTLPTVEAGYVSPRFRWAIADEEARPGDERWWAGRPAGDDIETFLAGHVAGPASTEKPLVVLGHPGSGKSLFTKVCAARLAGSDRFTAVRVALRDVADPSVPLHAQLSAPLERSTNGRVSWTDLCAASEETVRVLFIDGLDELMQATGSTQSGYLAAVAEFQRVERITGNPLIVVVTARTIVAELAGIPDGSLMVKLEDFSDDQVRQWLRTWRTVNTDAELPDPETVLGLGDLSHQPLLLLLLAVYAAHRPLPKQSSAADLYGALLQDFITRELAKPVNAPAGTAAQRRHEAMWQLGVVAFGMVNRGRLHLGEDQLRLDLAALSRRHADPVLTPAGALDPARRVIGRFFFITAAEADGGSAGRSYEFLHATFGEYLMAYHLINQLVDLHRAWMRPASQQWDDDLLFALLSHRLVAAGAAQVMPFARQLFDAEDEETREGVVAVLSRVIRSAPDRWGRGAFAGYDPSGGRYTDRMATYTANLVLLLTRLVDDPVPLAYLAPADVDPEEQWITLIGLWHAGFQRDRGEEWRHLLTLLGRSATSWATVEARNDPIANTFVHRLRLETANRVRGAAYNAGIGMMTGGFRLTPVDGPEQLAGELAATLTEPVPGRISGVDDEMTRAFLAAGETAEWLSRPMLAHLCRFGENIPVELFRQVVAALLHSRSRRYDLGPGLALLVALFPALLPYLPEASAELFVTVDSGEAVMTLTARDTRVETILVIGEAVWQRSDRELYGHSYQHTAEVVAFVRGAWPAEDAARLPDGAAGSARRALIRQAVAEIPELF
ncbi:NACHT domain-containing protein [Actinoplanes sp. G11-F43]|uniref:NACHT domain-containing protein n=1 Tax=Actinoplanes sp. G11-F43 TaxID=3424130 RepID=UPI003D355513